MADQVTTDLATAVSAADFVIVCTPVGTISQTLLRAAEACPAGAILTDAGSTKIEIVRDTESGLAKLASRAKFVGSHPLAGDHRTGPESARDDLLQGKRVVVTPTDASQPESVEGVCEFWEALGAKVTRMSPAEHDTVVARSSHLPHLVAAALAAATPPEAVDLAGAGWKDTTRVAAGDAALWRDILMTNQDEVTAALGAFEQQLADYRDALARGDGAHIQQLLEQGRQKRDAVGN